MVQNVYALWQCLLPFAVSVSLLWGGSYWGFDGDCWYYTPFALLAGAVIAVVIALQHGRLVGQIFQGVVDNVRPILPTLLFLFLIRALSVAWLLGGIIPAGIYYGLEYLHPPFFLVEVALFCGLMGLACGSSWLTVGTMGVVFLGIGRVLGFPEPLVAGAVISGAYFGDKLTPLSETTVLAASMTRTPLHRHVCYMLWTSLPAFSLSLLLFWLWTVTAARLTPGAVTNQQTAIVLAQSFNMSACWLLIPLLILMLTMVGFSPYGTLLIGTLLGYGIALCYQQSLLTRLAGDEKWTWLEGVALLGTKTFWGVTQPLLTDHSLLINGRLTSDGIIGMAATLVVIFASVILSGVMEGTGLLGTIIDRIGHIHSRGLLIVATTLSAIFFNMTVADQYLAIMLTAKMFGGSFAAQGLASENTSRAIEDAATVTSPLIKWNTCGVAQANALGLPTVAYLPYCFFNLLSPLFSILVMWGGWGIARINKKEDKADEPTFLELEKNG